MSVKKEYYTDMFQWAMLAINGIAVAFLCTFIYVTTNRIRANYDARDFLGGVRTISGNPRTNLWLCFKWRRLSKAGVIGAGILYFGIFCRCEMAGAARFLSWRSF